MVVDSGPLINLLQIILLIFREGDPSEFAEHLEESLYVGLLKFDAAGGGFVIEVLNDLLEVFELGVVVEEEGVDGHQVEALSLHSLLPTHQLHPLLQLRLRNFHL